jgi:hypothetical protein
MNDTKTLLWAAVEDYAGLWEAVWELRSVHPEASAEWLESTAQEILTKLLLEDHIELFWCEEPYGDMAPIPEAQARQILQSPTAWDEPTENAVSVRFSATPEGETAYEGMF